MNRHKTIMNLTREQTYQVPNTSRAAMKKMSGYALFERT
jgi:hypothetical protein